MISTKNWRLPRYKLIVFRPKKNKYCVCIPVLNEGDKFIKQLNRMVKYTKLVDLIVCDWNSTDGSTKPDLMKKLGVRALLIKQSFGKQGTQLRMGFAYALKQGYQGIIQIDGNGKDGVGAIINFTQELDKGYDYVQGSRFVKGGKAKNTPFSRWFGIRFIISPIISLSAKRWYTDTTNGFRAYSRKYLLHADVQPFRNMFISYSLNFYLTLRASQLGLKTKEIGVTRQYPKGKVPTKMTNLKSKFAIFSEALGCALGKYRPN